MDGLAPHNRPSPPVKDHRTLTNETLPRPLLWLAIVLLCLGIFFRFAHLDTKIYWVDEVATSIRIAGHTAPEVTQELIDRAILTVDDLKQYQQLTPETSFSDTFNALIQSPEHAPLYFLIARFWVQFFGSSAATIRSLSAILGLLALPMIYWFCLELFQSPQTGWISLMLLSISPFYVAYSQEARPYSLWTATLLLASIALLRAIRFNNRQSWGFHTVAIILSCYTSLLSLLVVMGQGLYIVALEKLQFTKTVQNYLQSLSLAMVAFSPWLLVIFHHWQTLQANTTWMREPMNLPAMIAIWIAPILLTFGDLPISADLDPVKVLGILSVILLLMIAIAGLWTAHFRSQRTSKLLSIILILGIPLLLIACLLVVFADVPLSKTLDPVAIAGIATALLVLTLVSYALYWLWRNSPWRIQSFLLSFALSIPATLILIDLILKGQSSATPRYMIPLQLGIQLTVSHLIASHLLPPSIASVIDRQKAWRIVFILLLSLSLCSCIINLEKSPRHQKNRNLHNIPIAKILNESHSPILLSEPQNSLDLLSLSHHLSSKTKIHILTQGNRFLSDIQECNDVFLFNPSEELKSHIKQNNEIEIKQNYFPKLLVPGEISLSLWTVDTLKPADKSLNVS